MSSPSEQARKETALVTTGAGTQKTDRIKVLKENTDIRGFPTSGMDSDTAQLRSQAPQLPNLTGKTSFRLS